MGRGMMLPLEILGTIVCLPFKLLLAPIANDAREAGEKAGSKVSKLMELR